jgi:hypothetical protein
MLENRLKSAWSELTSTSSKRSKRMRIATSDSREIKTWRNPQGNSDAEIFLSVLKTGPEEPARGEWVNLLGRDVCPEVYVVFDNGYAMEFLEPVQPYETLLLDMENLLEAKVWCRPTFNRNKDWLQHLRAKVDMPDPPPPTRYTLTHGDCTISNAMKRGSQLLIIDPLPPRPHVDHVPEADMGRLIQSAMGWEVLMYGDRIIEYDPPMFWYREKERRLALWWCACLAKRIALFERQREGREKVLRWTYMVAEKCFAAIGE